MGQSAKSRLEDRIYQIGEVAEMFGLTTRAIRFYEEEGLLKPIRIGRGRRKFGLEQIARIEMIVNCRKVGIGMETITRLAKVRDTEGDEMFDRMLCEVLRKRLRDIRQQRAELDVQFNAVNEWVSEKNCCPTSTEEAA
ncbi:MerR family transcriptional regulator [Tepidamorphus sp. 3E244]|uniref:MerR family transcriptional regulator n=1 Tax=Tepidamorphus sp. 3E244 TaxID=3385498 RepID=UPI0038FD23A6